MEYAHIECLGGKIARPVSRSDTSTKYFECRRDFRLNVPGRFVCMFLFSNVYPYLYYQVLNFGMIVSSALMIWKGLMVVTGSESPIVVVLSGSMEPAFHRGDLLFLTNRVEDPIRVGEIVVFRIEGREIPIVHRVLKIHEKENGDIKFLTKGDNNAVDDRGLYKQGQHWLEKKDVVGRARGFVPYIGIVTILMNDYPKFKYAVLFLLGLFVLVHRE
uniref:Signal peptidase complex catalytic subunit SEC11 n=2 Tax=Euteleosteomorpha TaxID=1489388 RepID=A0A6Q2XXG8_ESOLU